MVPPDREPSVGELVRELAVETSTLVREEVRLAKVEMTDKARVAAKDAGLVAAGGALAHAGILVLLTAIIAALAEVMPVWIAALIVGVVTLGLGALLAQRGLASFRKIDPTPERTVKQLQEDKLWLKQQVR